jgi:hypothetical protein
MLVYLKKKKGGHPLGGVLTGAEFSFRPGQQTISGSNPIKTPAISHVLGVVSAEIHPILKYSPPTPVTMSPSTHNTEKSIIWLFFDPRNNPSLLRSIDIFEDEMYEPLGRLDWAAEIKKHFKFRAHLIKFWRVSYRSTTLLPDV